MQEQQQVMLQQVMFKLTEMSFASCISKPSSSLSSSEQACVKAVVSKYFDASELILRKLSQQGKG